MKLFIGIPTSGSPTKPFVESLGTLESPESVSSVDRTVVTGNYVPAQRELIVRRALARGADRLLMCDDDMVLPKDALQKLSAVLDDNPRCALAGALYYSRDGFRPMAVDNWNPDDTTDANIPAFAQEPVTVDGVGFGCVLLRLDALHGMETPYFSAHVFIEPNASRVRVCNEDYLFCARLRGNDLRVVLHPGVRCGHFDRSTSSVQPQAWEPAHVTSQARMAVLKDGKEQLVPLSQSAVSSERHEPAALSYVWPGV